MPKKMNRLAEAASPYLRSAAHQPVDWYPWGEEAFQKAKAEDKPILLDIGAVWCHWCHVIDRESYEDPETAEIINARFVPIKVDRDERPDIDSRYQLAVSALSGQGGWPLTAFLTPEGKVFFGGTYFPLEEKYGRPGFKTVLYRVSEFYQKEKEKALKAAEGLHRELERAALSGGRGELSGELLEAAVQSMERAFDRAFGGFGTAPKFPHPSAVEFLLTRFMRTRERWLLTMVTATLERMAKGGIYDQLFGGFHRYSTDEKWIVPHFEKMSSDNAELLKNYLHAYQLTGHELFRETALGIIRWVDEVASDRERGGFAASQDADSGLEDDGCYWTWTVEEVEEALPFSPEEAKVLCLYYNIFPRGEMRENPEKNVLYVDMEPEEIAKRMKMPQDRVRKILEEGKRYLLEARKRRPAPSVDKTIYVNWNGMMISAYLEASKALGLKSCKDFALKSLDLLLERAYVPDRGFCHAFSDGKARIFGLLDDQVQMAQALLDAFEATGERRYLGKAEEVMDLVLRLFWDGINGGFFDTAPNPEGVPPLRVRNKPIQDTPTPSPNGVAALVLDRLSALTGKGLYRLMAEETLKAFAEMAKGLGLFGATYFLALDFHLSPPVQVVIVGAKGDERTMALHRTALSPYRPGKVVALYDPEEVKGAPLPEVLSGMIETAAEPRAYICAGTSCAPPTSDPEQLQEMLKTLNPNPQPQAPHP